MYNSPPRFYFVLGDSALQTSQANIISLSSSECSRTTFLHEIIATMNKIRAIQELNKREIENGISPSASWHVDYRDTAFVYFGGLPFELSEGDVITIFSQFGEPTFLKLARDKETGKSRGFGWLKYEDQRSTDLAVDNLGGATISGRMISVDHARYKPRDDDDPEEGKVGWEDIQKRERAQRAADGEAADTDEESEDEPSRPMLKEERELLLLKQNHDDDDPMKAYLIEEKEREVAEALRKEKKRSEKLKREHRHRHRHERSHRSRRDGSEAEDRHGHRRRDRDERDQDRKRSQREDTPVLGDREDGDHDSRRTRRRDDSRERDSGRDRDRNDRDSRRGNEKERRRHHREGSDNYANGRHRDADDRDRWYRRSRSRSP